MEFDIWNRNPRKVICISNTDNNLYVIDENSPLLEVGKIYTAISVDIFNWHTEVLLEEFPNKSFNSTCFAELRVDI